MAYEHVLYEQSGPVVTITLNRPAQLNALSRPLEAELHAALDEADADTAKLEQVADYILTRPR